MIQPFYKIMFDICCYYSYAAFFLSYLGVREHTDMGTFGLLAVTVLLAVFLQEIPRFHAAILTVVLCIPLLSLFWDRTLVGILELALPWSYVCIAIFRKGYGMYYQYFKKAFEGLLWVYLLPGVFFLYNTQAGVPALNEAVPFIILFLASGVMLLQSLRYHQKSDEAVIKKGKLLNYFEKHQLKQAILFFCISILLTVGNIAEFAGKLFHTYIYTPFITLITGGFAALVSLFNHENKGLENNFVNELENYREYMETASSQSDYQQGTIPPLVPTTMPREETLDFTPFIIVFGAILLVFILWKLFGTNKKSHNANGAIMDEREELPVYEKEEKKSRRFFKSPEENIRHYYRKFMKKVKSSQKRERICAADTTRDYKEKYEAAYPEGRMEADAITDIYRNIRYGKKTPGKKDVSDMKKLVNEALEK